MKNEYEQAFLNADTRDCSEEDCELVISACMKAAMLDWLCARYETEMQTMLAQFYKENYEDKNIKRDNGN